MSAKPPIALQLFSVRADAEENLSRTLKETALAGYAGAELYGFDGSVAQWKGHSATEIRKMFDDNGLKCCGFHIAPGAFTGDRLKRTADFNRTLGNRFLIIAADAARMKTAASISELANDLNKAVDNLKPYGMFPGYHAHGFDFAVVEGEVAWNRLFSATRQEVIMQLDTGNCAGGGGDPIAALRKFPGRAKSVHLKDHGGPEDSVIGEGKLDWKTIFHLCDTQQPVEWYVVEEGSRDGRGFEIPRRSLQALRKMGR